MKRWHYVAFYLTAASVIAFLFGTFVLSGDSLGVTEPGTAHFAQADVRVRLTEDAQISRGQDPVVVQLESGTIPESVRFVTVLADGICEADDEGVSHCLNPVEFETEDGVQRADLRHHHRFSEEPCLMPGATLEIVR